MKKTIVMMSLFHMSKYFKNYLYISPFAKYLLNTEVSNFNRMFTE